MNAQKDLIQHIAVLTVAPGYLDFSTSRSSDILHVGLEELKHLLRECLGILAAEDVSDEPDVYHTICKGKTRSIPAVLDRYLKPFELASRRIDSVRHTHWTNDLDMRYAVDSIISQLDLFLGAEHWYEVDRACVIREPDGRFYHDCSKLCASFLSDWRSAALFFSDETLQCALERLDQNYHIQGEAVPVKLFDPPKDFLWRARTYAPQTPKSLIDSWEALLPGSRKARIQQLVGLDPLNT